MPAPTTDIDSKELTNKPYRLVEADDWTLLTVWASAAGVSLSSKQSNTSTGAQVPIDNPLTVLLAPRSSAYVYSTTAGVRVSYAIQPVPPLVRLLAALGKGVC